MRPLISSLLLIEHINLNVVSRKVADAFYVEGVGYLTLISASCPPASIPTPCLFLLRMIHLSFMSSAQLLRKA